MCSVCRRDLDDCICRARGAENAPASDYGDIVDAFIRERQLPNGASLADDADSWLRSRALCVCGHSRAEHPGRCNGDIDAPDGRYLCSCDAFRLGS